MESERQARARSDALYQVGSEDDDDDDGDDEDDHDDGDDGDDGDDDGDDDQMKLMSTYRPTLKRGGDKFGSSAVTSHCHEDVHRAHL